MRASGQDAHVLAVVGARLGSLASADIAARVREGRLDAAGRAASRARGYATQAERWEKQQRLQRLRSRAAAVQRQLERGHMAICRGGGRLAKARHNLACAKLTEAGWRARWEPKRWFITADGEADKTWGNETVRWHPGEGWVEVRLPAPLTHLANRPHGRYRLSCQVAFPHRGGEVAAQAVSGAVRYDISPACDGRPAGLAPRRAAARRDQHPDPRGKRPWLPGRGDRGPRLRRRTRTRPGEPWPSALTRQAWPVLPPAHRRPPDRQVPDRLTQMAHNQSLSVIAVDLAYTSQWGRQHWLGPAQPTGFPDRHRPPCGGRGDRQTCARPPGAQTGRCDRR